MTESRFRTGVYVLMVLSLVLPPLTGISLGVFIGIFPFPEVIWIFVEYTGVYFVFCSLLLFLLTRWFLRVVCDLAEGRNPDEIRSKRIMTLLRYLMPGMLGGFSVYFVGGALSSNLSLRDFHQIPFTLQDHLYTLVSQIPPVMITVLPIFFFLGDHIGRYLAPRGVQCNVAPMWMKLLVLGLFTPVMIDTLLLIYYYDRTGFFVRETLLLWISLLLVALVGSYLAWRSFRQGIAPFHHVLESDASSFVALPAVVPLSMDEHGRLAADWAQMLDMLRHEQSRREHTELHFQSAFEQAAVGMAHVAKDGRWLEVNDRLCEMVGYSREELLQMTFQDITHADDLGVGLQVTQELLQGKRRTGQADKRYIRKDGGVIWVRLTTTLVTDEKGGPDHFVSVIEDIQDRHMAETALRNTNQLLQGILNNTHVMVACLDRNLDFIFVNEAYARADDRTVEFFPGKHHFTLYPSAENEAIFRRVLETGEAHYAYAKPFEYSHAPDRGVSHWDWSLIPTKDGDGVVSGLILTLIDVTERIRAIEGMQETEEKFQAIFNKSTDGIVMADVETGGFVQCNQRFADMLGYDVDEIAGLSPFDIHPETIHDEVRDKFERAVKGELERIDAMPTVCKNGSLFYADMSFVEIRLGGKTYIAGFFRDITEQRIARESVERLGMLIQNSDDFIGYASLDGKGMYLNRAGREMVGIGLDEDVSNYEVLDFFPAPDRERVINEIMPVVMADGVWQGEINFRHFGTGESIPVYYDSFRVDDPATGKPVNLATITRDLREHKRVEQLQKDKEKAELASQAKSEFLSRMSHELRTPMNAVLGFSQMLDKETFGALNEDQKNFVNEILAAGHHLLELINDVLDISRVEAGQLNLVIEEVEPMALVGECMSMLEGLAERHHVKLHRNACDCEEYFLRVDHLRLKQVLINLLANAIKYNHQGGDVWIGCGLYTDDRIRINVKDTGPGIGPGDQQRIFKTFERLQADQLATEGTGIGLALSKKLVEVMGGSIGVESKPGQGATFWVEFDASSNRDAR